MWEGGLSSKESSKQTDKMITTLTNYKGGKITYGPGSFVSREGLSTLSKLWQLKDEEGRGTKPPRTGYETKMYEKIKDFVRNKGPNDRIDEQTLLWMGLESSKQANGEINFQDAVLTVHNVVRILARPETWTEKTSSKSGWETMKEDSVFPILKDIMGYESIDGKPTLASIMGAVRREGDPKLSTLDPNDITRNCVDIRYPLTSLFDPEKGVFATAPGAEGSLGNGGAYYYYWLGCLARTLMGPMTQGAGNTYEIVVKTDYGELWKTLTGSGKPGSQQDLARGMMQLTHYRSGGEFGAEVEKLNSYDMLQNPSDKFITTQKESSDWYCTNRPDITTGMPVPEIVHGGDLTDQGGIALRDMKWKLRDYWKGKGLDTKNLEDMLSALEKQIQQAQSKEELPDFLQSRTPSGVRPSDIKGIVAWREREKMLLDAWFVKLLSRNSPSDMASLLAGKSKGMSEEAKAAMNKALNDLKSVKSPTQ